MTWWVDSAPDPQPIDRGMQINAATMTDAMAGSTTAPPHFRDDWWDDRHWNALREAGRHHDLIAAIGLDPPPDSQSRIEDELKDILAKQASDGLGQRQAEIVEEADGPPSYYSRMLFLDDHRRPLTRAVLFNSVRWSVPLIMHFKHHWKRPRPTQLEPRIRPVVDCPNHPAYPSGHSTQSHLVALVMGAVTGRKDVEAALWDAADRIAENREFAGLHYRSDSKAGAELAPQILPAFLREFAGEIGRAHAQEW